MDVSKALYALGRAVHRALVPAGATIKKAALSGDDVEALQRAEAKRARKRAKLVSQGLGRR